MAMHAGEIAKLTSVDLENFSAPAAKRERTFGKRLGESIHYKPAATAAVATAEKVISSCRCSMESKKIQERESVDCFYEKMRCRIYRYVCARVRWNGCNRDQRD